MATHAQNIENLRTATYGEQVRGSMIELFEEDYDLCKNGVGLGTDISSASDPTTGYPDGTLYINTSSWHLFKLEGTAWSDKGVIKGDQGESVIGVHDNGDGTFYLILSDGTHTGNVATVQGIQGPQGPQGPTGATGPQGRSVTSMQMTGTGRQHTVSATFSDGITSVLGIIQDGADGSGTGDMSKATYDVEDVGYVDKAAALTDGTNIMPYSTVAGKADAATTLAGYGITDAYTATESDERFMQLPSAAIEADKYPVSDGSSGFSWEDVPTVDQTYNGASTNAQSGVAVASAIVHFVDATLPSGQTSYNISNALFRTTSRIVAVLADSAKSYRSVNIVTNGTCTLTFPSALTSSLNVSIGISNAPSA